MLQEHTLGKQFQTRPNADYVLLLFAAHGPLFTNPGPLLADLRPGPATTPSVDVPCDGSWTALVLLLGRS